MDRKPVRVVVTFLVPFLLALPLTDSASAQFSPGQQFAPYSNPPYPYDRVEGECVNLETELIAPILCIPDPGPSVPGGDLVAVANDADERVVFLDMNLALVGETFVGQGPAALALNPAAPELWVSVRNQSSVVIIDLLSLTVKQVLRPAIDVNGVGAGRASTPGGIAFANGKAYVASTFTDELLIYDAVTTGHPLVNSLSLIGRFHQVAAILNDPYAVVSDGNQVLVTSHLSGNNTAPLCHVAGSHVNFDLLGRQFLGPDNVFIEALGPGSSSGLDLSDYDVAVVDATTDKVTRFVRGVGTVLFDVAAAPAGSGNFLVTNLEAQNTIVGEDAFPQGKVALNRLTQFNATGVVSTTVLEGLGGAVNVVMPTDLEILPDGRRLVAGYCSSNVGVLSGAGAFLGAIPVPAGPRGIDYWAAANRIFVLSRATSMVTSFDAGGAATVPTTPLATFTLTDPMFDRVKQGRLEFLLPNSGAQTANCATCHVDGRNDGIGWNLSKRLSLNPDPLVADDFRDHKGVMITQDLRGLPGAPPYHWRGEQKDIDDFNGAFEHLLHGTQLTADRLAKLKDYFFSLEYPPNPFETMNRVYSTLAGSGFTVYANPGSVGVCSKCHALPLGTNGDIAEPLIGDTAGGLATDVAALRGLWTRTSTVTDADPVTGPNAVELIRMTGFGLLHEGMVDTLQEFMDRFFQPLVQAGTDDDVMEFVNELDSGLAPATLYSVLVDAGATVNANMDFVEFFLLDQARAGGSTLRGNCDIAAHGIIDLGSGRIPVGMVYRALPDKFDLSSSAVQATWEGQLGHPIRVADVRGLAVQGKALLLFAGVPSGSGERVGIDRDRDGMRDDDEITTDPKNPDSNGDGLWDGFVAGAPQVVNGSVQVVYATSDAIKISYETDRLSPTIVDFVESGGSTTYHSGDGLQVVGPGTSNQWRRRHTAFIRPQPPQGLTALRPVATYNFTIQTQGQDDLRATFPGFTALAGSNFIVPSFRCSQIQVIQRTDNHNGTFTFEFGAVFEATQGSPTIDGKEVPGRFIFTDANDQLSFVNTKTTIVGGVATFKWTTAGGASPQQASGKPVFLDLPMWLAMSGGGAGSTPISFPDEGQWSDSVTSKETTAP
jgi:mono/diheme cytochrome c family protein